MNRLARMLLKNIGILPKTYRKLCYYAKHTDEYPEEEKFDHIRYMVNRAVKAGNIDLTVTGKENVPLEGGCLMYANHQGMFDVLALAIHSPVPLGTVYKKEISNVPFLKQVYACTKSFAMDREDVRQSLTVIQAVTKEVSEGRNYVIFPEGTRSKNGNTMNEFHGGSFRCALKSKVPVVPVAFIDSFKVLDQKGSKPVSVQMHFLKPIFYEEYKNMKTVDLAALVKARIQTAIDASTN